MKCHFVEGELVPGCLGVVAAFGCGKDDDAIMSFCTCPEEPETHCKSCGQTLKGNIVTDAIDVIVREGNNGNGQAVFSPCEKYRYVLWRTWQKRLFDDTSNERAVVFLMLNPSTADHNVLDNTVTMCRGHAMRWHFESLYVVNLFAWRATDPKDMKAQADPVGKLNDVFVKEIVGKSTMTVLACGNHAIHNDRHEFIEQLPQDNCSTS